MLCKAVNCCLSCPLYRRETSSVVLQEKRGLRVFECGGGRGVFGFKERGVARD